jgi:hypothetical protein
MTFLVNQFAAFGKESPDVDFADIAAAGQVHDESQCRPGEPVQDVRQSSGNKGHPLGMAAV